MNRFIRISLAATLLLLGWGEGMKAAETNASPAKAKTSLELIKELYGKANGGDAQSQFLLGAYYDAGLHNLPRRADQAAIWYGKAAAQGNAAAQNALGTLYNTDRLGKPDYGRAMQWFQAAADQGLPLAQYNLGYMHYAGNGVEQDQREALRWIGKAAAQGFAVAQFTVGRLLHEGTGLIEKNHPEAFKWFQLAANQGNAEAQYYCGIMLFQGQGVEQDYVRASHWLRLAAVQEVPNAAKARDIIHQILSTEQSIEASTMAKNFKLVPPDQSTAEAPNVDLLAPNLAGLSRPSLPATIPLMTPDAPMTPKRATVPPAAQIPDPPKSTPVPAAASTPATTTATSLAEMPRTSVSGTSSPTPTGTSSPVSTPPIARVQSAPSRPAAPAPPATTPAPKPAAAPAQAVPATGSMLPPVHEVAPIELVRMKLKAVEGDSEAQFQMGRTFARGEEVNQNFREAFKWHTLAAQQGHAGAQTTLGKMHLWGRGVNKDTARAGRWLQLAAEQGDPMAQFWIGSLYQRDSSAERAKWLLAAAERGSQPARVRLAELYLSAEKSDPIEAYKWLELAANQGSKDAVELRKELAEVMSKTEIEKAKDRALQFIPKRPMTPLGQ